MDTEPSFFEETEHTLVSLVKDCDSTEETNNNGEPKKDRDGWIQFAVQDEIVKRVLLRGFVEIKY